MSAAAPAILAGLCGLGGPGSSSWGAAPALALDLAGAGRFLTLADPNARWVLAGSLLLGVAGGVLGAFALLRRQALLGDALAHAALPGVCVAFLVTGSKAPLPLFAGALLAGALASLAIASITRLTRLKEDTAIAVVLSVSFAFGLALLSRILRLPGGNQSGLDRFLFGQAASLLPEDLAVMAPLVVAIGAALALWFEELKLVTFDPAYAASLGLRVRALELLLTALIVLAVVTGLQAVGVVLMAAMLITPAAAARQWTDRLGPMVLLSGAIGALSGATGALLSSLAPRLPTGPLAVLAATFAFAVSLLAAPERGLLARLLRHRANRARVRRENILKTLFLLGERAADFAAAWTVGEVGAARGLAAGEARSELGRLAASGLAQAAPAAPAAPAERFQLTAAGLDEARRVVRNHRLWELYLVHRAAIAPDHVHRDAEDIEHVIPPELARALEERLARPALDPHGRPIPAPGAEARA